MQDFHFICYSKTDGEEFAIKLYDALLNREPSIYAWIEKRNISTEKAPEEQPREAIRTCQSLLFVATKDSVQSSSACQSDWIQALRYKKPVIPLILHAGATLPLRLGMRKRIDFSGDFEQALTALADHLAWLVTPEGQLQSFVDRLGDAERDIGRVQDPQTQERIQEEITLLQKQIGHHQRLVMDPQETANRVEENIQLGLLKENENQPSRKAEKRQRSSSIPHRLSRQVISKTAMPKPNSLPTSSRTTRNLL